MNTPAADVQGTAALLHICCNLPLRTLYIRGSKYALMAGMGNNTHRATKRHIYSIWLRSRPTALTALTIIERLSHQIGLSLSLSLSLYVFSVSLCLSLSPPPLSLPLPLPLPPPPSLSTLYLSLPLSPVGRFPSHPWCWPQTDLRIRESAKMRGHHAAPRGSAAEWGMRQQA